MFFRIYCYDSELKVANPDNLIPHALSYLQPFLGVGFHLAQTAIQKELIGNGEFLFVVTFLQQHRHIYRQIGNSSFKFVVGGGNFLSVFAKNL